MGVVPPILSMLPPLVTRVGAAWGLGLPVARRDMVQGLGPLPVRRPLVGVGEGCNGARQRGVDRNGDMAPTRPGVAGRLQVLQFQHLKKGINSKYAAR